MNLDAFFHKTHLQIRIVSQNTIRNHFSKLFETYQHKDLCHPHGCTVLSKFPHFCYQGLLSSHQNYLPLINQLLGDICCTLKCHDLCPFECLMMLSPCRIENVGSSRKINKLILQHSFIISI